MGKRDKNRTEVIDPKTTTAELTKEALGEFASKDAVTNMIKVCVVLLAVPTVAYFICDYFGLSGEMWAISSIILMNVVMGIHAYRVYQEEKTDYEKLQTDKDK